MITTNQFPLALFLSVIIMGAHEIMSLVQFRQGLWVRAALVNSNLSQPDIGFPFTIWHLESDCNV